MNFPPSALALPLSLLLAAFAAQAAPSAAPVSASAAAATTRPAPSPAATPKAVAPKAAATKPARSAKPAASAKATPQAKKAGKPRVVKAKAAPGSDAAAAKLLSADVVAPERKAWLALTPEAARLAQWVRITHDHQGHPFAIIDKRNARLFVFDPNGSLRGDAPVLLGLAPGDHTVPGIGDRPLSQIRPEERTTPAGRFQAEHGLNTHGEDIIWVDYDAAVSLHRVRPTNPVERRLQRLASETVSDNRISYGCINVPKAFYEKVLLKHFEKSDRPVVYVLPEEQSLSEVFAGFPGSENTTASGSSTSSSGTSAAWISVN